MANFNLNNGDDNFDQNQGNWDQNQGNWDQNQGNWDQNQGNWDQNQGNWDQNGYSEYNDYNGRKPPSTILVILTLLFVWPVGLFFTWKTNWSKLVKIIITVVFGLFGVFTVLVILTGGVKLTAEVTVPSHNDEEIVMNDEELDTENNDSEYNKYTDNFENEQIDSNDKIQQNSEVNEAENENNEDLMQNIDNSTDSEHSIQGTEIDISEIGGEDQTDIVQIQDYTLGETLNVHTSKGDFSIKFNSIEETMDRNSQSDFSPIRVILLNYTVKNISYSEPLQVLPYNFKVYDYLNDEMKQYYLNTEYGNPLNIGESGDVSIAYGLNSVENQIKIEYYTNTNWEELPKFVINIVEW